MIVKKTSIKLNNQLRIISLLQSVGPLSRKIMAEKLHLTRASITQLTNEMIEEQGEVQEIKNRVGRKEILVDINEDYWYLLGINIEIDAVSVGLVTIKGNTLAKACFQFNILSNEEGVLEIFMDQLILTINKVIKQA